MDLLITVVGLLIAVYTVMPRARRLDLGLRFGILELIVFIVGFLAIFYLDLYSFFKARHLALSRPAFLTGLTATQLMHVVTLLVLLILVARSQLARLTPAKIFHFRDLTDELLWSESYSQMLTVLEVHLTRLFKIYHADFWPDRLRRTYSPAWTLEALHEMVEHAPKSRSNFVSVLVRRCGFLLPSNGRYQMIAAELMPKILLSKGFVSTLARSRPYFGLEILDHLWATSDGFLRRDFFELYVEQLMSNRTSVFYTELSDNRNNRGRLLTFLFSDATIAYKLEVYRPVGEFVLQELDHLARRPEDDPYNRAYSGDRSHRSDLPLSSAIQFFGVMVSEALRQGIEWHMWLYYVTHMTKSILRNYKPFDDPIVRLDAEFPIWYSYLLYQMFSNLSNWILAINELPETQKNIQLNSTRVDHENNNIPKSAILALGDCVHQVLLSKKLNEELLDTLMSAVFGIYFDLRRSTKSGQYAEALRNSIVSGGFARGSDDSEYKGRLRYFLRKQDRFRFHDFMEELEIAFA